MPDWSGAMAIAGKWVLLAATVIFVPTMIALAIYALRKGQPSDTEATPSMRPFGPRSPRDPSGITAYKGGRKLKMAVGRETFIPMASLVNGTATRQEWAVVVGIQVALICFWLIFLGIGLMYLPSSNGLSLLFPGITGVWLYRILKAQRDDFRAARRKLAGRERT